MRGITVAALVLMTFGGMHGEAHHSYGGYEATLTRVEGTVQEFRWMAPHSFLVVETEQGERYFGEWSAPAALTRAGIDQSTLKPGDRVVVFGLMRIAGAERVMALRELERPADGFKWPAR
jgi:hypothetical protein